MKAKDFKLNSLVWAKMKGFSPWPAKIAFPADGKRPHPKKPKHFVTFFGTHDNAWILDEFIYPHSRQMLQNTKNYKKISKTLKMAITEIKMESRKLATKLQKVQVKIENCDEIPQKLGIATEKSGSVTSKNKMQVQKKPRKQPTSDITTDSKIDSQVETKYRSLSKVKVKIEPKDPYNENSLLLGNATEKSKKPVFSNKTENIKGKVQNEQVSYITSNEFKNNINQVKKEHRMLLRQQVKKEIIQPSDKKFMELKFVPKSSKSTICKNKTRLEKMNSKMSLTIADETSASLVQKEPNKFSKMSVKIAPIVPSCKDSVVSRNTQNKSLLPKKPICQNRDEIEKTNKSCLETLLDIKKEPTSDIIETANKSSSKNEIEKKIPEKVKIEHSDKISQQPFFKKFTRTTSRKKMVVKKIPRKQLTTGIATESKTDSLQMKCSSLSKLKYTIEPKDPSDANSIFLDNTIETSKRLISENKTPETSKRLTSENKTPIIDGNSRKRTISENATGSKCDSLHVKKKHSMPSKIKMEPKASSDENSLEPNNIKDKSINETEIVKKKPQKRPVSDIMSNDFRNDYTPVEKKRKSHLREQVRKELMEHSDKKTMELKIAPKASKKTISKNKTQLGKKNSKTSHTTADETSTCRNEMEPERVSKVQIKVESSCNILGNTEKPICRNRAKIKKTNRLCLETLLDIKKEPTNDIKENSNKSSSKNEIEKKTLKKEKMEHYDEILEQQDFEEFLKKQFSRKLEVKKKPRKQPTSDTESKRVSKVKATMGPIKRACVTSLAISERYLVRRNGMFNIKEKIHPDLKLASDLAMNLATNIGRLMREKLTKPFEVVLKTHSPDCKCEKQANSELNGYAPNVASTANEKPAFYFDPANPIVGFLGIGERSNLVLGKLLRWGYTVVAWNQSMIDKNFLEMGLKIAKNPAEVISSCNITFCCVSDPDASKRVVYSKDGVLDGLKEALSNRKGYVKISFIDHPTSQEFSEINQDISRASNQEISEAIKGLGGMYLEVNMICPMPSVHEVATAILAGGDKILFDACQRYFKAFAYNSHFVGCKFGIASEASCAAKNVLNTVDDLYEEAVKAIKDQNLDGHHFYKRLRTTFLYKCHYIMYKATTMFGNSFEIRKLGEDWQLNSWVY